MYLEDSVKKLVQSSMTAKVSFHEIIPLICSYAFPEENLTEACF